MNINVQSQTNIQSVPVEAQPSTSVPETQTNNTQPDYTSMKFAILEIADPVSFEEIKEFYGKK